MVQLRVLMLVALGLLVAGSGAALPVAAGADEANDRERDARQTAEAFLAAALAGKAKEAAALGEPGKAWSREEKIASDFGRLNVKTVALVSLHADEENALAVTDKVTSQKREGPLLLTLVKKEKRWLIRDVDLKTEDAAQEEVKRFQKRFPRAEAVLERKGK